jgi:hypothetical protein
MILWELRETLKCLPARPINMGRGVMRREKKLKKNTHLFLGQVERNLER